MDNDFREKLVSLVKAAGQELINRAEDLVGNGDLISDFDIWIRFPNENGYFGCVPEIEVTRRHVSKESLKMYYPEVYSND